MEPEVKPVCRHVFNRWGDTFTCKKCGTSISISELQTKSGAELTTTDSPGAVAERKRRRADRITRKILKIFEWIPWP